MRVKGGKMEGGQEELYGISLGKECVSCCRASFSGNVIDNKRFLTDHFAYLLPLAKM